MAKTYTKGQMRVTMPNDALLAVTVRYLLEASSQTFKNGSPLIFSSGYATVGADALTSVEAFALEDGHNITAGTQLVKVVPAVVGSAVHLRASFLTTAGADNVLAVTDWGVKVQMNYSATAGPNSTPIWFAGDSASGPAMRIVDFAHDPDYVVPNQSETRAFAGDTNARVTCALLDSAADWAV